MKKQRPGGLSIRGPVCPRLLALPGPFKLCPASKRWGFFFEVCDFALEDALLWQLHMLNSS